MTRMTESYFPLPESRGGWRVPEDAHRVREVAGIDPQALEAARSWNADLGIASSIAIVRRGYLVAEWYEYGTDTDTRFNIYLDRNNPEAGRRMTSIPRNKRLGAGQSKYEKTGDNADVAHATLLQ